ncbi:unnamed protein product, partial [Laminaria digitata]
KYNAWVSSRAVAEQSQGRGGALFSELLTCGAQYLTRNITLEAKCSRNPTNNIYGLALKQAHSKSIIRIGSYSLEGLYRSQNIGPKSDTPLRTVPWDLLGVPAANLSFLCRVYCPFGRAPWAPAGVRPNRYSRGVPQ